MKSFPSLSIALLFALLFSAHCRTPHIDSPWATTPKEGDRHHIIGGATGYSGNDDTKMIDEGAGWYSIAVADPGQDWLLPTQNLFYSKVLGEIALFPLP